MRMYLLLPLAVVISLKIKPHSSLQILKIKWNIPDIWRAVSEKTSLPELVKGQTNTWVVWQKEIKSYYMMLNTQERM